MLLMVSNRDLNSDIEIRDTEKINGRSLFAKALISAQTYVSEYKTMNVYTEQQYSVVSLGTPVVKLQENQENGKTSASISFKISRSTSIIMMQPDDSTTTHH